MWSKLHVPWRGSGRTSPTSAQQRVGNSATESVVSLPGGLSTIEGAGLSGPLRVDTHQGAISFVRFLPDAKHIFVGGNGGTIRLWKIEEEGFHASEIGRLIYSDRETRDVVVSKDGKWIILSGTDGRRVTVWDATTCERVVESIEAHEEKITALDVSPDTSKIASGSRDGTVILWCLGTGRRIAGPLRHGWPVLSVRFSPMGDRLASAGSDFSIHVWGICSDGGQSMTCVPTDPAYSLAWSNDGRWLFVGCYRGSILRFDVSSSTPITTKWPGHPHFDSVSTLRLSNNGRFIISASSSECSVKIYDVNTQSEILSLNHTSEVLDAEISPDDGHLVSGTKDGKISIWNLRKMLPSFYFFYSLTVCRTLSVHSDLHPIVSHHSPSGPSVAISPFKLAYIMIQLTEINNAAYVSWRKADLTRAEEILSSEIEHDPSLSHYHLANRSLVRTRLRQWDKALDDAQKSLLVRETLVALLAKSAAQSGQGRCNSAIEVLNDTLEKCDQAEKDFVNLVKAITLFDAGHCDEAILHANDLTVRSPDAKLLCAFVQARMYTLLAANAMNSQQYVEAMSLFAQARDLCPSNQHSDMDTLSLISGWVFDNLRLAIYQQSCEACYAAECMQGVLDTVRKMESIFKDEINLKSELNGWLTDLKSRCAKMLESQGDGAMRSKNYESAVEQYSAALVISPAALPAALFVKRSEARIASCLWEGALKDADEAIRLDPSSPWGYERKHAALHKLERYGDAIDALETMVLMLENSSDPEIRGLRGNYISPTDSKNAILDVLRNYAHNTPFRLLDTTSGRLCDTEKRRIIFTEDPVFQELVSSMTTQLQRQHIDMVTRRYFQYVMLSHRWEAEELELVDVSDKSIYELDASPSAEKLQRFCYLAREAKFRWAWSDTCCIDKDRDVEFERSINSMFHWYRCSAATIVYLTGVPPQLVPGGIKGSVWMTRGWTLQELLAPPIIRFYYEDWTPYLNDMSLNHKESTVIMQELEEATGVTKQDLLAFSPGPENVRVKLRLASTRETTVPVDMAYGLFGIFGVTMPVIHGESQQNALGRLFQEIIARSGDIACIAWIGHSSEFNSAFPDHIRVYEYTPRTVLRIGEEDLEKRVIDLRKDEAQAMLFYQRLHALPPTWCTNQHLHLPCIVFPLTTLKKIKQTDGVRVYHAMASFLEDTDINTRERFLSKSQGAEDFILVCPWIQELLDTIPLGQGRRHHPTRDGESPSDSDSESGDMSAREPASISFPDSHTPLYLKGDTTLKALKLVVRFRRPLSALLLLAQGHGQYRRVATDHDIIIRVRDDVSLDDMVLRTLDII